MQTVGPYTLLSTLGSCQVGDAWSGLDEMGAPVTVAVLNARASADQRWREAFAATATALAQAHVDRLPIVAADFRADAPWVACSPERGPGAAQIFLALGQTLRSPDAEPEPERFGSLDAPTMALPALNPRTFPTQRPPTEPARYYEPPAGPPSPGSGFGAPEYYVTPDSSASGSSGYAPAPSSAAPGSGPSAYYATPAPTSAAPASGPGGYTAAPTSGPSGYAPVPSSAAPGAGPSAYYATPTSSTAAPTSAAPASGPGGYTAAPTSGPSGYTASPTSGPSGYAPVPTSAAPASGPTGYPAAPTSGPTGHPAAPTSGAAPDDRPYPPLVMRPPSELRREHHRARRTLILVGVGALVLGLVLGVLGTLLLDGGDDDAGAEATGAPSPSAPPLDPALPTTPPSRPGVEPPRGGGWPTQYPSFADAEPTTTMNLDGFGFEFKVPAGWKCEPNGRASGYAAYDCNGKVAGLSIGGDVVVRVCEPCPESRRDELRRLEEAWGLPWIRTGPFATFAEGAGVANGRSGLIYLQYWRSDKDDVIDRQLILRMIAPPGQEDFVRKVVNSIRAVTFTI